MSSPKATSRVANASSAHRRRCSLWCCAGSPLCEGDTGPETPHPWGALMTRCCWLFLFAALIAFGGRAAAEPPVEVGRSVFVVSDVEGEVADTPPKRLAINDDI